MKLSEIAKRIDKSDENKDWIDIQELGSNLGIQLDWVEQSRLRAYWIGGWMCTDTHVGHRMYFLDDEPVAYSYQNARRSDENIKWFSQEALDKVRQYLISLLAQEGGIKQDFIDINEDIGEGYTLQFNANMLYKSRAKFNGEDIEILERVYNKQYGIDTELKIKLPNGEEKNVLITDLIFKYKVLEEA